MTAADFDLSEWDFLPPLDEAALPENPPASLVLVEWAQPAPPVLVFADPADAGRYSTNVFCSEDIPCSSHAPRSANVSCSAQPPCLADALRHGVAWRQPGLAEVPGLPP
ncbi:MAG: hypothetical protein ABI047_03105 [Jatrophihabitantaceae bacterium]